MNLGVAGELISGGVVLLGFIYKIAWDIRTRHQRCLDEERSIMAQLPHIDQLSRDMWTALGPGREHQVVSFYQKYGATYYRANEILTFWNTVGEKTEDGRVNRRRFLPRIARHFHAYWSNMEPLINHLSQSNPSAILNLQYLHDRISQKGLMK